MKLPDFLTEHSYGSVRLTGHRIGLEHLLYYYNEGYSPEMLLAEYPTLSAALIQKVLGFYRDNQAEVDAYLARCEEELERQRATAPKVPTLADLQRRPAR
jgi:uncharacterized protein (DUF433 family)